MPPRLRLPSARQLRLSSRCNTTTTSLSRTYASLASAPTATHMTFDSPPPQIHHYATNQPPSYKPAEFRKTQLHRQYASLLRSSPLILLFQHNNLKAVEWSGLRRELAAALKRVDAELSAADPTAPLVSEGAKLQIVQTGIFASAVKVVEHFTPSPDAATSIESHRLSKKAYMVARAKAVKLSSGLEPLLSGPLMAVSFPAVSPQHLKAALQILAPNETFPAPKRRVLPGLYEVPVQTGLQKLMLLGARVEGEVFDMEGTRWVGGIEGGIGGLRSQLVQMLQSVGAGLTNTLEGAGKALYVTMESRRIDMEGPPAAAEAEKKEEGAEVKKE